MKKVGHGQPGKQNTTPHEGALIEREIDAGIEGSWIRRAGNEPAPSACAADECRSVVALALALAKADRGWDPREVWLRRIHEPRQSRAEDGFQHLSDASPATTHASDEWFRITDTYDDRFAKSYVAGEFNE